jgi:superfamily II DNA helicase RecQ
VIVSPKILNNDSRFEDLWGTKRFVDNLINLVLDEAHVVKEWGGTFRSDYLKIGPVRYLLTQKPPVGLHLRTATLPPSRIAEIMSNLHLRVDNTTIFRLSTDRPNIFLSVHKMQFPVNSFQDLAFMISKHTSNGEIPPKFLVFFNSRAEAQLGADFLRQRLPPELRDKVKWFHSGMTDEFRETEMHALLVGEVYAHAATDAAGMVRISFYLIFSLFAILVVPQGIDIPDVTLVVQYRVPRELSTWIQRAGRAARNPDLSATAVLIAEPTFFDEEREAAAQRAADRNAKKRQAEGQLQLSSSRRPGSSATNAQSRAEITEQSDPGSFEELRCEKAMDNFINAGRQAEKCRREVVNIHFGNNGLRE